jgi:enoyl-CoA hydratase/carnithine racemase
MNYEHLLVREGTVATITMNRPEKRNALSLAMMHELIAALRDLAAQPATRALILSGNGPAFSAGHDLRELVARDIGTYRQLFDVCTQLMTTIQEIPQPVIARVHGIATAAGCQLVAMCDLVVASEQARFAVSGINVGLFCSTPGVALSRQIGRKPALEMLFTGEFIDARTALARGLVNRVVPAEALDDEVGRLVASIVAKSPAAVASGKRLFYEQAELGIEEAYEHAAEVQAGDMLKPDAAEGIDAFLQKRPPRWQGR